MKNKHLKRTIISPPFGTYVNFKDATSVLGTFTCHKPQGSKWIAALKTIRLTSDGWVNKIGLKGGSIYGKRDDWFYENRDSVLSIGVVNSPDEWDCIGDLLLELGEHTSTHGEYAPKIELNVSCPNVEHGNHMYPDNEFLDLITSLSSVTILKLSPRDIDFSFIERAVMRGVDVIHCSNTFPHAKGGLSGRVVRMYSLENISYLKGKYPRISFIGGGGIYSEQDVIDYHNAGADHFSLATVFYTPWKVRGIMKAIGGLK